MYFGTSTGWLSFTKLFCVHIYWIILCGQSMLHNSIERVILVAIYHLITSIDWQVLPLTPKLEPILKFWPHNDVELTLGTNREIKNKQTNKKGAIFSNPPSEKSACWWAFMKVWLVLHSSIGETNLEWLTSARVMNEKCIKHAWVFLLRKCISSVSWDDCFVYL